MIAEPFSSRPSILDTMDPRIRIFSAVAYALVIALCQSRPALSIALGLSIGMVLMARLHPWTVVHRLLPILGFLALLFLVVPVTHGGHAVGYVLRFPISREGLLLCIRISAKSVAMLLSFMALVAIIPMTVLGHSLDQMGVPGKLVYLFLVTYRYIFVFEAEYQRLLRAAKVRGFRPTTTIHAYRTYAFLLAMLFVRAAHRADRVFQAMKCRGFNGRFYSLAEFTRSAKDYWFAGVIALCCIAILSVEWGVGA